MKKFILAACVAALGLPVFAQQPAAPVAPPPKPGIDYGYYGGPSTAPARSLAPATRPAAKPLDGLYGPYRLYNVPDDLTAAEQERDRIRSAAVEFGRFRRQFTGSTQFWMDEHRTELAKSRYAMDEPLWRALHPAEYFGDGGYLYNTAESVGSEVVWGPAQPIVATTAAPAPAPIVNTAPADQTPVPASRQHVTPAPRVIAGSKPLYDAAASVAPQPGSK
jgi:hypothetical protein